MRLEILSTTGIAFEGEVGKVVLEAADGSRGLLPRHQDYVAALEPGILSCVRNGREIFMAVDEGVVVKQGDEVLVSTMNAVTEAGLGELRRAVRERFLTRGEHEERARLSMARLEAGFARRFLEYKGI
ncbi:hypothetical protein [Desulfohalovibrio reitneri]|uniref:hypothetical protein n=1 Tax=Desulfohalovibrio reitneri TaxID=1307759 RepID=UPI0004A7525A|nr:hypothetical protein [Desulfohalovibrio reitneri]